MTSRGRKLEVLYEDNHLLVVNKPAQLPTMGVAADRASLLSIAKQYIGQKYKKPGNVYLGIVSRLDAPVTGVVLMARTSKAAARLSEQFRTRTVEKTYWAIVVGEPKTNETTLHHFLRHDERHRKVHTTSANTPDATEAILKYRLLNQGPEMALLEVAPETGRKHQIRVQLAKHGHPIIGDRKYGSEAPFSNGIALHAQKLVVTHPVKKTPLTLSAPLPSSWQHLKVMHGFLG